MNMKMALAAILVILAAATVFSIAVVAFNEAVFVRRSTDVNVDENFSSRTTFSDRVQLLGEDRGGGWP